MIEIIIHKLPLFTKKEIWFYNGEPVETGTYTSYCYVQGNFNFRFENQLNEFTSTINLSKDDSELFNAISTTFKYEIRKAEKLNFRRVSLLNPSIYECKQLITSFNKFARTKKISKINRRRVFALQKTNNIIFTKIFKETKEVVTHVYLFDKQRVLLMHTFHHQNDLTEQVRGFANKYLHWKDILLFKSMNFNTYDFGGIDIEKVPGISRFKLSYGGEIQSVNNYTRVVPLLKPLFKLYKLIRRGI